MDSDTLSSVSSFVPAPRNYGSGHAIAKPSGGGFLGGNLVAIARILCEIAVIVAMAMWVRSRTNSLQKQVNELRDVVDQQTTVLNQHTQTLQMLMGGQMNFAAQPEQAAQAAQAEQAAQAAQATPPAAQPQSAPPAEYFTPEPSQVPAGDVASQPVEHPVADHDPTVSPSKPGAPRVEVLSPVNETDETDATLEDTTDLDSEIEAELAALN